MMALVRNPILPGCHPDPSICRVGDDYYVVTSTFEYWPGLPIFHSTDLVNWRQIGAVVTRPDQLDFTGIPSSGGLYAPTIRHHDGLFWVVCTLVDQRHPGHGGNFLMTASDPAGPWSDPIWLAADGIDPSLFFDDDGRVWMHGTRPAREPRWHDQTEVWVREYDRDERALVGQEHVIWHGALEGVVWAEGPHIYRVNGTYYLIAAEGGTEFHHAISVARASSVTGPYVGSRANPVLTHRHLGEASDVFGVGHADLVEASDGSWWALLLGMRAATSGLRAVCGRETFLVPVAWQDGWPVFAPGEGRVPTEVAVPFAAQPPARVGGVILPHDPRWTSLRAPASTFATPSGEGWLLQPTRDDLTTPGTPAFVAVRQQDRDLDFAVVIALPEPGTVAGIAVRQSEDDHARVELSAADGGRALVRLIHRAAGVDGVVGEAVVEAGAVMGGGSVGAEVTISVRVRELDYAFFATVEGREVLIARVDGGTLASQATGGFLGLWLGVFAASDNSAVAGVVSVRSVSYVTVTP